MILDSQDPSAALLCVLDDRLFVDGLDGEWIDDPNVDAVIGLQLLRGLHGLVQSDASSNDEDGIWVRLYDDLGFADLRNNIL